jgi:hypothetical protein
MAANKGAYRMAGGGRTSMGEIVNLGGGVGANKSGTRFVKLNARGTAVVSKTSRSALSPRQAERARALQTAYRVKRERTARRAAAR